MSNISFDISSAPKDGTFIDLLVDGEWIVNCQRKSGLWVYQRTEPEFPIVYRPVRNPTHWRPANKEKS